MSLYLKPSVSEYRIFQSLVLYIVHLSRFFFLISPGGAQGQKKSLESDVGGNKERQFKLNISSLFDENGKLCFTKVEYYDSF